MITHIFERLAIGAVSDVRHAAGAMTAFLNVAEEIDLEGSGRAYHKIPLRDIAPVSPEMLRDAIAWIREAIKLHGVLIFCNAGIGRAPSIAIAYLCSVGFGYDEALRFVSARRAEIAPLPNLASSIEDCISFYL